MFDPTIYDNLKIIVEGAAYDVEDLGFYVFHRADLVDLASMSREFQIGLVQQNKKSALHPYPQLQVRLRSGLDDFAAELGNGHIDAATSYGCHIAILYAIPMRSIDRAAEQLQELEQLLRSIWSDTPAITHQLRCDVSNLRGVDRSPVPLNDLGRWIGWLELTFDRKIDESNADDLSRLMEHAVAGLKLL